MTHVEIDLLGGFTVTVDGTPAPDRAVDPSPRRGARRRCSPFRRRTACIADRSSTAAVARRRASTTPRRSCTRRRTSSRKATGVADSIVLRDEVVHLFPDADIDGRRARVRRSRAPSGRHRRSTARRSGARAATAASCAPRIRTNRGPRRQRERLRARHHELLRLDERWDGWPIVDPGDERAHVEIMRRTPPTAIAMPRSGSSSGSIACCAASSVSPRRRRRRALRDELLTANVGA